MLYATAGSRGCWCRHVAEFNSGKGQAASCGHAQCQRQCVGKDFLVSLERMPLLQRLRAFTCWQGLEWRG